MTQRKAKQSRAHTLARRRTSFQTMKECFRIVQHYRRLCRGGMRKGEAAQQTAEVGGCSASTIRKYERLVRQHGKRGLMPEIRVRETPSRTPWEVIHGSRRARIITVGKRTGIAYKRLKATHTNEEAWQVDFAGPSECNTGNAERPQKLENLFFIKEPIFEFQFC